MISTPDRQTAITLTDDAVMAGARHTKACCELKISERTLRRWTKDGEVRPDQRPVVPRKQPANALSAAESMAVLDVCNSKEFSSLPPSQTVPKLANQDRYLASESSFYRILRANVLQYHRGRASSQVKRKPPTRYQASASCEVWTWDITWMPAPIAGIFFSLYLIADIFSRKIVSWEIHERENADQAAILIRQAVLAEGCNLSPLVLHADNGSPMKGATKKVTMEKLGITASNSRPRVSYDNPFSEALFRTCKYHPKWPTKGFATKADVQAWVQTFTGWYNSEHLHSAIRFVTPNARHAGHDRATLTSRANLDATARAQNPQRWSGKTRNWQPGGPVWLNPENEISAPEIRDAA